MTSLLSLRGVQMRYATAPDHEGGSHSVLSGVDLELAPGERLGVVGANGAGKSTLLRVMAKVLAPVAGEVQWGDGVSVSLLSLGLGFRDDLTGRENSVLSAILQGFSRSDAGHVARDIEEFCELGVYFDEPVKSYSSGMRARLGFAAALLNRSEVLLIDEVLAVGDAHFRHKARNVLLNQLEETRGMVLVSHSEEQVKRLCTRAVLLQQGRIAISGDPAEVLAAYSEAIQ